MRVTTTRTKIGPIPVEARSRRFTAFVLGACLVAAFVGARAPGARAVVAARRVVAGVELVPTRTLRVDGRNVPEQCTATAHALGYAVPCPSLLPRGTRATVLPEGLPCSGRGVDLIGVGCDGASRDLFASLEWPTKRRVGHLVLFGLPSRGSVRDVLFSPQLSGITTRVTRLGSTVVQHHRATWVAVGPGSESAFGGHLVLVWSTAGHTYALGFHGTDDGARQLDLAVANSLVTAAP